MELSWAKNHYNTASEQMIFLVQLSVELNFSPVLLWLWSTENTNHPHSALLFTEKWEMFYMKIFLANLAFQYCMKLLQDLFSQTSTDWPKLNSRVVLWHVQIDLRGKNFNWQKILPLKLLTPPMTGTIDENLALLKFSLYNAAYNTKSHFCTPESATCRQS